MWDIVVTTTVRVVIEIEGQPHDVAAWLSKLPDQRPNAYVADVVHKVELTPELVQHLVQRITKDAKRALWYMAQQAPVVPFKWLQSKMEIDGLALGGVLASVGFADRAGLPRPYVVDRGAREYRMDPAVAEMLTDAIRATGLPEAEPELFEELDARDRAEPGS